MKIEHKHQNEDTIQEQAIQTIRLLGVFCYHVANEGATSAREGAFRKRRGVLSGVPDIVLHLPGGRTGFIELKTETGKLRPGQVEFERRVKELGCLHAVCRSVVEVKATVVGWIGQPSSGGYEIKTETRR